MGKTLFGVSTAALMVAFAVGWAIPNTSKLAMPRRHRPKSIPSN